MFELVGNNYLLVLMENVGVIPLDSLILGM